MLKKKKENNKHEQENGHEEEELLNQNEANSSEATGEETSAAAEEEEEEASAEQGTYANEVPTEEVPTEEIPMEEIPAAEISTEEKLKKEIAELNDKYLRLYAEFDNFKRRSIKERIELIGTASKGVLLSLLPVLDDFDRAQKSMEATADISAVKEGIDLISTKFRNILLQQGVKEMETVGQPFNADLHEAVTSVPAPSEDMKGKVIDQLEKGYYLNDKVIRFAKVLVGA